MDSQGKGQPKTETLTKLENTKLGSNSNCDCAKQGCNSCVNLKQRIENLEAELTTIKNKHNVLKKIIPNKAKLVYELKKVLNLTPSAPIKTSSQPISESSEINASTQTATARGRAGIAVEQERDKPKLRAA